MGETFIQVYLYIFRDNSSMEQKVRNWKEGEEIGQVWNGSQELGGTALGVMGTLEPELETFNSFTAQYNIKTDVYGSDPLT